MYYTYCLCMRDFIVYSVCFFFFKQKTAYEMRISDWSSDVCSSDLKADAVLRRQHSHLPSLFRGRARHPRHGDDDLPDAPHGPEGAQGIEPVHRLQDRKSTRLNSSH